MSESIEAPAGIGQRRLHTPRREDLLGHYAATERYSKAVLAVECAVVVGLVWSWVIRPTPLEGLFPWVAFGFGALGVFRWFLHHLFLNKKRLEDVRPDARFGSHTRDSLVALVRRVFAQLGLKPGAAPVFITRAKDVNAHAVRCELWPGMHLFNGVYLNRSMIHLLDEPELASVVGHELGHVFPYAPLLSRGYLLHALFAGVMSFSIVAHLNTPAAVFLAPVAVLWLLDWVIAWPHIRLSRSIEFLCDDHGAKAAGLLPSLSCEMKINAEQETRQHLLLRLFEARQKGINLSLAELAEIYEEAVPFGKTDPQSFEKEFQKQIRKKAGAPGEVSLGGYLNFLKGGGGSQEDEFVEAQLQEAKQLIQLPLLIPNRHPFLQGSHRWSLDLARILAEGIESRPDRVLFQLPMEVDDRNDTHPSPSRRYLFLWRNRQYYPDRVAL